MAHAQPQLAPISIPQPQLAPASIQTNQAKERFYRPELDALRFLAFFAVLFHHIYVTNPYLSIVSRAGGFGVSLFFLLSAYLITELLLREREKAGTVDWRKFFVRRALRIWPLYFGALVAAAILSLVKRNYWVSWTALAEMSVFVVNWFRVGNDCGAMIRHLWTISIEEQFYMLWAPVMKFGGARLAWFLSGAFIAGAIAWMFAFSSQGWKLWDATPVEFLFFAAGALLALVLHRKTLRIHAGVRVIFAAASLASFVIATVIGKVGTDFVTGTRPLIGFGCAAIGCVALFLAVLGMNFPGWLTYLGKISYGLYVYHIAALNFAGHVTAHSRIGYWPVTLVLALALCIGISHLSYQHFETPFLRIKERFAVVKSRPT
jgi:peptidoglycan/LPS O-acetylase OafA/YrhL